MLQLKHDVYVTVLRQSDGMDIFVFDFIALGCMMWYHLSKGIRSLANTTL